MNTQEKRLQGKVALITGASSGIGAATVAALLAEGARVVAVARRLERLQALQRQLNASDLQLHLAQCDVAIEAEAERLISETQVWGGRLDILINNAGVLRGGGPHAASNTADLRAMIETNVFALANLTRLALPALTAAAGDVINVSSTAVKSMVAGAANYTATKAAVVAFSESLRKEVGMSGVRVLTIYPGFTDTELFDSSDAAARQAVARKVAAGEILKSEDLAAVICFALTRPAHVALNEIVVRPAKSPT
jgi:NADP-dependent 3-hydroxy acid dehydrogenase YdfG